MILIFSGADRLRDQFAENFESHHDARIRSLRHFYEVHLIPNANHVFSESTWVAELLDDRERWLATRYPTSSSCDTPCSTEHDPSRRYTELGLVDRRVVRHFPRPRPHV